MAAKGLRGVVAGFAGLAVSLCLVSSAEAETMQDAVAEMLKSHERLKAAEDDVAAARERIEVEWGGWYPALDVTAYQGHEEVKKGKGDTDTSQVARNIDASITQQLWDFGSTNARIERARLSHRQSTEQLSATRQSLALEAIRAYVNLLKAVEVLDFAKASEANIKRQTDMENALVERGSGFSTDVLQAKSQLAGAEARRVRAEGALKTALNRFKTVFRYVPENLDKLVKPKVPDGLLPESQEEAVAMALKANPTLRASQLSADIARQDIKSTLADEALPVIDGVVQRIWKRDDGGTLGGRQETIAKVEMSYNFNLGGTAVNSLHAAEFSQSASQNRYREARHRVEERARNAWDDLVTTRRNAKHLRNQANIAAEFLELARKERQLGRRSLIDVLSGETTLINAQSDATSAEFDVISASYALLSAMGQLSVDAIR